MAFVGIMDIVTAPYSPHHLIDIHLAFTLASPLPYLGWQWNHNKQFQTLVSGGYIPTYRYSYSGLYKFHSYSLIATWSRNR
jgi:hypothetical protein